MNKDNFNEQAGKELSLQLSQKTFSDIILNFLGKKEKLTYKIKSKSFFIRLNDLEQFYYLLGSGLNL